MAYPKTLADTHLFNVEPQAKKLSEDKKHSSSTT